MINISNGLRFGAVYLGQAHYVIEFYLVPIRFWLIAAQECSLTYRNPSLAGVIAGTLAHKVGLPTASDGESTASASALR